jgi:hypothetical protein
MVEPSSSLPGGTKGFHVLAGGIGHGTTAGVAPIHPSTLLGVLMLI